MDETSQTLRQWLLLRKLAADARGVTIKRLVQETGVSDKTIRRDVKALQEAGFAIEERVEDHGRKTFTLEKAELPLLTFTCDEALALYLCRSASRHWTGTYVAESLQNAFRKIQATLPRKTGEYLERMASRFKRTSPEGAYGAKGELLDALQIGVEDSREVRVTYRSERATEPVTYVIHPYGIVDHGGKIYVKGYSPEHGELRTWKLDRMSAAKVMDALFSRPADFDLDRLLAGSIGVYHGTDEVTVRVRIGASAARYACEKKVHASQQAEPQRDGGVILQWRVTSTVELRGYILSFGAAAEVLEPRALRDEVRGEIEALRRLYAADEPPAASPPAPVPEPRQRAK